MENDEKQIQTEIFNYLRESGYFVWRNYMGPVRFSGGARAKNPNKGSPDLFAIRAGVFYGIEVKKPGGRVSPEQYAWLEKLRNHGGIAVIADSLEVAIRNIEDATMRF